MYMYVGSNIRIYNEYEGGIEKIVPRITDCHQKACRDMTVGDPILTKLWILFSCSPLNTSFILEKLGLPENPEYAEMRHGDVILTLQ